MANYNVTLNLITGTVINETITGALNLSDALDSGTLDTSGQTLAQVRSNGYNYKTSLETAVNYSPYIIGSIQVEEDV